MFLGPSAVEHEFKLSIMSLFWILEKHSGCLRDDDGTDMMSRADIADFLSVEQLENVHRGEDFEDNNKDIAVGDVSASERRLDNDQNQFDGSGHIMIFPRLSSSPIINLRAVEYMEMIR
ncbi:hypothetical protein KCU87_g539, partial [Aureobasidium melanogenum]